MSSRTAVAVPLGAAAAGAVGAMAAVRRLDARPPGGADLWLRTNHAGRPVTLLEGPAYVAGVVAGAVGGAVSAAIVGQASGATRLAVPTAFAALAAGALGALDDLTGDSSSKGLRGHLRALRHGRVTTGAVKVVGLGVTGLAVAAMLDRSTVDSARRTGALAVVSTLVGGAVVAASANMVNLLDLRPGRALKAVLLHGAVAAGTGRLDTPVAAAVGAALACLPGDLAGRSMLGDTGANSAGAVLGCAVAGRTALRGRLVALTVLTALTVASEKVSFTAVIESTPVLREIDAFGR